MFHFPSSPFKFSRLGGFGVIVFIIAFAVSLVDTVWSVYIYQFTQSTVLVGLISTLFTVVSLLSFVLLIPFLERNNKSRLYQWSLLLMGICYILFLFTQNIWVIILLGVILSILTVIRINCFGIIVRDTSPSKELAGNVGIIYTTINLGWLVGPLVSAFLAERYGLPLLFLLAAFFFFLALLSFKLLHIQTKKRVRLHTDGNFLKNIRSFFNNKDFIKTYIVTGAPAVWWSFIFVYAPLYIIERGLELQWVAYFLFAVMIPVLLLEYYFNILADTKGYRKMFVLGNILLGCVLFVSFFIDDVYVLLSFLVLGSVGIAMVESSVESYFFLIAPKKDLEKNYSLYNTSLDVFPIIAKLLIAGSLAILQFSYSFLVLALLFFLFALVSHHLKEISGQAKS